MNSRKRTEDVTIMRLMDIDMLCAYLSMGKTSAKEYANSVKATRRFGRMTRYDKNVIDASLDQMLCEKKSDNIA